MTAPRAPGSRLAHRLSKRSRAEVLARRTQVLPATCARTWAPPLAVSSLSSSTDFGVATGMSRILRASGHLSAILAWRNWPVTIRTWNVAWYRFRVLCPAGEVRTSQRDPPHRPHRRSGDGFARGSASHAVLVPHVSGEYQPLDLSMAVYSNLTGAAGRSITIAIERLADVARVRTLAAGAAVPLNSRGAPRLSTVNSVVVAGSTDSYHPTGSTDHQGISPVLHINQIVMTPGAARIWGVRLGQTVPLGFYAPSQASLPGFGTSRVKPHLLIDAHVVGIVAESSEIVQDDVDKAYGFVFISPALVKKAGAFDPSWLMPVQYEIQLRGGLVSPTSNRSSPIWCPWARRVNFTSRPTSSPRSRTSLKPESVALGAFGVIAALVCLLLSTMQSISRLVRRDVSDRHPARWAQFPGAPAGDPGGSRPRAWWAELCSRFSSRSRSHLAPLGPVRAVLSRPRIFLRRDGSRGKCPRLTRGATRVLARERARERRAPRTRSPLSTTPSVTVRRVRSLVAAHGGHTRCTLCPRAPRGWRRRPGAFGTLRIHLSRWPSLRSRHLTFSEWAERADLSSGPLRLELAVTR